MQHVKAWKDDDGFALEFEDRQLSLSEDGVLQLIEELQALVDQPVNDCETYTTEWAIDLPDE